MIVIVTINRVFDQKLFFLNRNLEDFSVDLKQETITNRDTP